MNSLSFINAICAVFQPLSNELAKWIDANLIENEAMHQMRKCKRYCMKNKLNGNMMLTEIKLCFPTETAEMQENIEQVLTFEIYKN